MEMGPLEVKRYRYDTGCIIDHVENEVLSTKKTVNRLNKLTDENERIKQTIREAYDNERTTLGKSVLKQLIERIQ